MASPMAAMASPSLVLAVVLVLSPAPSRALAPALRSDSATITGALDVSMTGTSLKHWGVSAVTAAFVPDGDRSASAQAIRDAGSAEALCAALAEAKSRDAAIAVAHAEGDGNLQHGAGDQVQLAFRISVPRLEAAARGVVYLCSSPVVAVIARGNYPDERFERVTDRRFRWSSAPLTLHPGEATHIIGAASVDSSQW